MSISRHRAWARAWSLPVVYAALVAATVIMPTAPSVRAEPAAPPKKLVILGASYAASWGAPTLPGYVVVNRGVGGQQTRDMNARFQRDVVATRPDAVLIWGHINNITQSDVRNLTPEGIEAVKAGARADYVSMLKQARAAGIDVMLATEVPMAEAIGPMDHARALLGRLRGKPSYRAIVNTEVRDLNVFVRQLAARENLRVLDFEKVFAPDGGGREPEYATDDHSHITKAGYQALTAYAVAQLGARR